MAETIFCLDIHQDRIAATSVDISSGAAVVTGYGADDYEKTVFAETVARIKEESGFTTGTSRVTLGAELFSYRTLSLPFNDNNKIDQILSFELADLCPIDINTLAVDFLITRKTDQSAEILVAMIDKTFLSNCLEALNGAGIDPDTIGISGVEEALLLAAGEDSHFTLIDIETGWATVIIVINGSLALIRSITSPVENQVTPSNEKSMNFALSIKQTLKISGLFEHDRKQHHIYLSGDLSLYKELPEIFRTVLEGATVKIYQQSVQPLIKIEPGIFSDYIPQKMDRALALAVRPSGKYKGFDFRKGDFKKRRSASDYRAYLFTFAIPVLAILISTLGYWGYTYTSLQKQQEELKNQITDIFTATLPEVTRIANPVQQLTIKNRESKATYRPGGLSDAELTIIELLAELSSRIPKRYNVKIVRMVADMEVIRLKAVTEDFNTVDSVQKELEKSPFFKSVSISSANQSPKGDEVSFELRIQRTF